MYPNHNELIQFIHLLGYPNHSEGICFGLVAMAISPVLNGSTDKTNARLANIKKLLDAYNNMKVECEKDREECPGLHWFLFKSTLVTNDEAIDILAYCEGIIFHFSPDNHRKWFPADIFLEQNISLTNDIVQSIETAENGGVISVGNIVGSFRKDDVKKYIAFLSNYITALDKETTTPSFSIKITRINHAIHIAYSSENKQWCFFKINQKEICYDFSENNAAIEKLILSELFSGINDDIGVILSSEMFCLNKHKNLVKKIKDDWYLSLFNHEIVNASEKKAGLAALGDTWLSSAVRVNDIVSIRYLLAHREVDVNLVSAKGFTPLEEACRRGYKETVELLISKGADLNRPSLLYGSPIIIALINKQYEIVMLLIDRGANLFLQDANGYDVLDHAIALKKADIIEYILKKINLKDCLQNIAALTLIMKAQELHEALLLPGSVEQHFNKILENITITDENKHSILMMYIITRENEYRNIRRDYNSKFAQFFSSRGSSDYHSKIQAAKAILNQDENWQSLPALKSGRLEKIAALFYGIEGPKTKSSTYF